MVDILECKSRIARKEHICNYCGKKISPGEVYAYGRFIEEGEIFSWKEHPKCGKIADKLMRLYHTCENNDEMNQEYFLYLCKRYCQEYVCPECEMKIKGKGEMQCVLGKTFCREKIDRSLEVEDG